jgi:hypothetical protein
MKSKDIEIIQSKIYIVRKKRVMLDVDLSTIYGVETRVLNQAVKRNLERFPEDFMFQLTESEFENLKSQIVTSSWGGTRKLPYAFTEHGVIMLASVLNSATAINASIQIVRVFTKMRELLQNNIEIYKKLEQIERNGLKNSKDIETLFQAVKELYGFQEKDKSKKIGFDK